MELMEQCLALLSTTGFSIDRGDLTVFSCAASSGGPGRTRTCNQTVMSGGIMVGFVDFVVFLVKFDRIRCGSRGLLLVRNWCGSSAIETWT
jgi:hypothetical protein